MYFIRIYYFAASLVIVFMYDEIQIFIPIHMKYMYFVYQQLPHSIILCRRIGDQVILNLLLKTIFHNTKP